MRLELVGGFGADGVRLLWLVGGADLVGRPVGAAAVAVVHGAAIAMSANDVLAAAVILSPLWIVGAVALITGGVLEQAEGESAEELAARHLGLGGVLLLVGVVVVAGTALLSRHVDGYVRVGDQC